MTLGAGHKFVMGEKKEGIADEEKKERRGWEIRNRKIPGERKSGKME